MLDKKTQEAAERIERRTQRILWASGLAFFTWQLGYFSLYFDPPETIRTVDWVRGGAFIAWCAALLMLIATGGGAFSSRQVRELVSDELARAMRAAAYRNGFWAMTSIAIGGYVLAHFYDVSALTFAHAMLSAGVLVAVLTLAWSGRSGGE